MTQQQQPAPVGHKWVTGGNVPGGHHVLWDGKRKPFITPMKECNSIPLRTTDVVVDIGAYVGTYAVRCARFPVRQVIAYEPTPRTYEVLRLNAHRLPNLVLRQAAVVGDASIPTVTLHISGGIGVTNSVVQSNRKVLGVTVPAVAYAEAVRRATIVKIDVEGAEYDYPIVQPSLRAIIIDFHPLPGVDWVGKSRAIMAELAAAGFKTVVEPDFNNGWTRAGSWVRDLPTPTQVCRPLLHGEACCGCGEPLATPAGRRALCPACWTLWTPRQRTGYLAVERAIR